MAASQLSRLHSQFLAIVGLGSFLIFLVSLRAVPAQRNNRKASQQEALESFVKHDSTNIAAKSSNNKEWPVSLKLPTPVIVVGYPKSGTTSVYQFFNCSGVSTQHFCCCGDTSDHPPCEGSTMAVCILNNMAKPGTKMLQNCGDYQVYGQLDGERPVRRKRGVRKHFQGVLLEDGSIELHDTRTQLGRSMMYRHFLPQHFHLSRLHEDYPQATYILPLRDPVAWANSVFNWFQMRGRFVNEYISFNSTIERPGKARAKDFLARIYDEHNEFVRQFVRDHPSHALVQVNITDPQAGQILADAFGLDLKCWGHHNKIGNRAKQRRKKGANKEKASK